MILITVSIQAKELIQLNESNTYMFRGSVNRESVGRAIKAISELDEKLPAGQPIYLALSTPGGSVLDGQLFLDYLSSLNREIKTVAVEALSMGFVFIQLLGERLALSSAVLMDHQAWTRCSGNKDAISDCLSILIELGKPLQQKIAERLGLSMEVYQTTIVRDKYYVGNMLLENKVVDKLVNVRCSKGLIDKKSVSIEQGFFGSATVYYSSCPLLNLPLSKEDIEKRR